MYEFHLRLSPSSFLFASLRTGLIVNVWFRSWSSKPSFRTIRRWQDSLFARPSAVHSAVPLPSTHTPWSESCMPH